MNCTIINIFTREIVLNPKLAFVLQSNYNQMQVIRGLTAHFGDCQPKLGVLVTKPIYSKGNIHFVDSYGRGNVHNSKWQYKPKNLSQWLRPMPFPACIIQIEKAFKKREGKRFVFGGRSDPFMWMDHKYKTTLEVLRLAKKYSIGLSIETMSDLVAHDDYLRDLVDIKNLTITMNMGCGISEEQERLDSPGAPSLKRRMYAAQKLREKGFCIDFRVKGERVAIFSLPKVEAVS